MSTSGDTQEIEEETGNQLSKKYFGFFLVQRRVDDVGKEKVDRRSVIQNENVNYNEAMNYGSKPRNMKP